MEDDVLAWDYAAANKGEFILVIYKRLFGTSQSSSSLRPLPRINHVSWRYDSDISHKVPTQISCFSKRL